ncbi:Transposase [Thioalkalivibrio nitratireducens DSM 14787]|uniref:Transposase n=1 Tax=Thioalkalivibrio nitratireducens (strain DSM 14787 / UNIQEM 213 / ALEN2) TaxID=1255043 RepID=L0DZQ5_THIND|nr:Transposase [Thioalkalivibrio nitratireducens DSM 14787]
MNRRRTQLKVLYFDGDGFCVWSKRLEQGQFALQPGARAGVVALSGTGFQALLEGLQFEVKKRYRLAQCPGSYVILEYHRPVLKRRDTEQLITTPAPANVHDRSVADVSFLAGMLIDKFLYHLPLYRQHQRLLQSGIQLSRMTLGTLAARAIGLLEPIYKAQLEHIRQGRVVTVDETPIKAGRSAPGKMRSAYFWPVYGEDGEICFPYASNRHFDNVEKILGAKFTGGLQSDGYGAYERFVELVQAVTHAGCWAHTRRYFERALDAEPQAAGEALRQIRAFYAVEEEIRARGLEGAEKLALRTEQTLPKAQDFWRWCDEQCHRPDLTPSNPPSNPLSKALVYARGRIEALQVFLHDPDVAIDPNHIERTLRPIPMGKKNFLFAWTELGAKQIGIIQSLIVTCRLQGISPSVYLTDVLQRVSQHPARDVIDLTPRRWKILFADDPLRSDLDRPPPA